MTPDESKTMIKRHEGFRDYVYMDSAGYWTIGYGHALHPRSKMPKPVLEALFEYDYANAVTSYDTLGLDLDPVRQAAVTDMIFNIGIEGIERFKKMMAALKAKDFETAADEVVNSIYYSQVGNRAREIEHMIRTGTCSPIGKPV